VRNEKKMEISFYFLSSFQWKWRIFHNNLWLNARSKNWEKLTRTKIKFDFWCMRDLECNEIKVKALAWLILVFHKNKNIFGWCIGLIIKKKTSQDRCLPPTKITPTNIEKNLDNFSLLGNSGYFSPIFTFFKPECTKKWAGEGLDKVWRFSSHFCTLESSRKISNFLTNFHISGIFDLKSKKVQLFCLAPTLTECSLFSLSYKSTFWKWTERCRKSSVLR